MNTFFTSDHHFFHANIIKHCSRPYETVEDMHSALIHNWNSILDPRSTIYILGDFSFGTFDQTRSILDQLNGIKFLIPGNHDRMPASRALEALGYWTILPVIHSIKLNGRRIVMSHFPLASWHNMHRGAWMLHGHSHGTYKGRGKILDVGADAQLRTPLSFHTIKEMLDPVEFEPVDHHGANNDPT